MCMETVRVKSRKKSRRQAENREYGKCPNEKNWAQNKVPKSLVIACAHLPLGLLISEAVDELPN